MMRRLLLVLALILFGLPAAAQPVSLFADEIRLEAGTGLLIARGNVEVFQGSRKLTADEIRYDRANNRITAIGDIRLSDGEGTVILASLAELSPDFQDGLIEGARLILDQQFQIASVQAQRSRGRFNTLHRTVASSCRICDTDEAPVWRVRARRIVHDEQERRLYFEGAWIDILGVPIGYVPVLRVPEPGVRRADGFLLPTFTNSDIYGFGVKVPYFQTLGDHADITVAPFISNEGAFLLEADYRQRNRIGIWSLGGALAIRDDVTGRDGRGFLRGEGTFALPDDFRGDVFVYVASDKDFLREFTYDDADRLNSVISVNRYDRDAYLDIRAEGYQTLRDGEDQGTIPLVLPKADFRRVWYGDPLPGKLAIGGSALGLHRTNGRDVVRLGASADWRGDAILANGMQVAAIADVHGELYFVDDDPEFDSIIARLTPSVGAELRWPFARRSRTTTHVIEPMVQVFYSDTTGDRDAPNEDSLLPEFDETSLFSIDRFPGIDDSERGLRLNYGVNYTRYEPSGWGFGLTLGQVVRDSEDEDFSEGTGLSTTVSDYVAAVSWELPPNYSLIGRTLFDTDLDFKRGELEFSYDRPGLDIDLSYTFLAEDTTNPILGPIDEREQVGISARYRFRPNWEVTGDWRYDLTNTRSIEGGASLTYGNECAELGLTLNRRLTSTANVPRGTEISLRLRLSGLGGSGNKDWPARTCGG